MFSKCRWGGGGRTTEWNLPCHPHFPQNGFMCMKVVHSRVQFYAPFGSLRVLIMTQHNQSINNIQSIFYWKKGKILQHNMIHIKLHSSRTVVFLGSRQLFWTTRFPLSDSTKFFFWNRYSTWTPRLNYTLLFTSTGSLQLASPNILS